MVDTPSSILLLRLQGVGGNVNTWGGYLNTTLSTLEQASKGYQSLTVSASAVITWTQYTTGNTGQTARLRLTGPTGDGTLASAAVLTLPSYDNYLSVWNATGATITIMCSGGTGVAIQNNTGATLYCDSVDYFNAAPTVFPTGNLQIAGQINNLTAGVANTDAVNVTQMETAIATAGLPATAGTVLNSGTDTTAGYLNQKLTTTLGGLTTTQVSGLTSLQFSTVHGSGNEQTLATYGAGYVGGFLNGGYQNAQFTPVIGNSYDVDCSAGGVTINLGGMTTPQLGQSIKLNKFGAFSMFLLGTVNGGTNFSVSGNGDQAYRYSGATWGWN